MESIYNNLVPTSMRIYILMISNRKICEDEFLRMVSNPYELHIFTKFLTSRSDLFVDIIINEVGLNRVMRLLGRSDDINTILLYSIMSRFPEIMTHKHGKYLASRVLAVCNMHEKNMFYHITYTHALFLARDENGCNILKNVITIADDPFKHDFLELIAQHAHSLCMDDLGISLIQHVLNLEDSIMDDQIKRLIGYHAPYLTKEPHKGSFIVPQTRRYHIMLMMTSCKKRYKNKFLRMVSVPYELHKFANILTSCWDLFVEIIRDKVGINRVMRLLGISDDINTILLYPIMSKFPEIMTHEHGKNLASRVLTVCNMHEKNMFYHITYRQSLILARDENGCNILKSVITIADDLFKDDFLDLITQFAHWLCMDDLGISLIQHVLNLEFTQKTTEVDMRLHDLMAEFDEILPITSSDTVELHQLASKLTSNPNLFFDFVKTKRGSLIVMIILGKSEEIDRVFWEAIKQRFTDIATDSYGCHIMLRTRDVLEKRGDSKVDDQLKRLMGYHALYLTKEPEKGNFLVQQAINSHNLDGTELIACGLQCHYIELSFLNYGSNIVEMLVGDRRTELPLLFIVMEIVKCDEDTLVRLAMDKYGNAVLKRTLEVAKAHRLDLFGDLVDKLKPFLDSLYGSPGENIAAIVESLILSKDEIV